MRDIEAERAEIDAAIGGKTLCTALAETAQRYPDLAASKWRGPDGSWQSVTWAEYRERVRDIALGLRSLGFAAGDFGVIMARNRPEHVWADMGIVHAGGTPVSLYNTLSPEQVAYVAGHCEARVAIVEDAGFLEKFLKVRSELPLLERVVLIEPAPEASGDWFVTLDEVIEAGRAAHASDPNAFDEIWKAVTPDSIATLIYTSGTTGPPKGVMDTHRNVLWHFESFRRFVDYQPGERVVSYLPLAHAAERVATHWNGILAPLTVHFCPDLLQLLPTLVEARPTIFVGVPRVWEKLYAGLNAALASQPEEIRSVVQQAIDTGREVVAHEQKGVPLPDDLRARREATLPVGRQVLGKVGLDETWIAITGAAPIATEVIEFFHALGLRLAEVWGMSELTAVGTSNPPDRIKIGSIGVAGRGVEVTLGDDGEILVRGGNRMIGYYKDPEKTADAIDSEGWMHTGDVGTVDEDGYFTIVDRKKELIITAGGKNISPANLENLLKQHPLIGQACVIGDRRAYLSALIVLDPEVAPAWAAQRGIEASTIAGLTQHPAVLAEIESEIAGVNERVSRVENIRRWTLLPGEWTAESEELTPTMKLKRRVINEKYADVIGAMYE